MRKLVIVYQKIAILLLNSFCLLLLLNGTAWFLRWAKANLRHNFTRPAHYFDNAGAPIKNGAILDGIAEWFDYSAMKELPEKEAFDLIVEYSRFSVAGARYVPWAQFAEPEFHGRFVNTETNAQGFPFRVVDNPKIAKGEKARVIWVFGGSTTFGYESPDSWAWPARLSLALNDPSVRGGDNTKYVVTNFGHLFYYSSQEAALAVHMLKTSPRPYAMVFMDGVNEASSIYSSDQPNWTEPIKRVLHLSQDETWMGDEERLGLFLSNFSLAKLLSPSKDHPGPSESMDRLKSEGKTMFERYMFNVGIAREAARLGGTKAFFFIQPDAVFNYPAQLYRRTLPPGFLEEKVRHEVFHERVGHQQGIYYLGELFNEWGKDKKAIVDQCHYSPAFNDYLAHRVAAVILK